jgi:hypothetical protein
MKYLIKKVVPVEIHTPVQVNEPVQVEINGAKETLMRPVTKYEPTTVNTLEDVEEFEEKPAPEVTLGGRLLALKNETGYEHVAIEAPQAGEKS